MWPEKKKSNPDAERMKTPVAGDLAGLRAELFDAVNKFVNKPKHRAAQNVKRPERLASATNVGQFRPQFESALYSASFAEEEVGYTAMRLKSILHAVCTERNDVWYLTVLSR